MEAFNFLYVLLAMHLENKYEIFKVSKRDLMGPHESFSKEKNEVALSFSSDNLIVVKPKKIKRSFYFDP